MIDLLVGALAMVALLWTMNATNSGDRGTGDTERSSAMALVEQYGLNHIQALEVSQPGRWTCRFDSVSAPGAARDFATMLERTSPCTAEPGHTVPNYQDGAIRLPEADGSFDDDGLRVILRTDTPPGGQFFVSVSIAAQNLTDRDVVVNVEVAPCCDPQDPHYVRALGLSGAGPRERHFFWHDTERLAGILDGSPSPSGWVTSFRQNIAAGEIRPSLAIFDIPGTGCDNSRANFAPPALGIVLAAEGDVRFTLPDRANDDPSFATFAAAYEARLMGYITR